MEKKTYTLPDYNNTPLSDKTLAYIQGRGISKATVLRWKLTESKDRDGKSLIEFNYFRNEKLVNVKYRTADKKFRLVSGAELIFYGLDFINNENKVVICEGEFDALSFFESGVFNVISVPNGASKGNMKLEYLENCMEYFEDKEEIYLATDGDEPGIALREELARRLGKERCFKVNYPEGCKDANEVLLKHGGKGVKELITNSIAYPIDDIVDFQELNAQIDDIYENGYPEGLKIGYKISEPIEGYSSFDDLVSFISQQFIVITGIPGSGKSEFADQIMLLLSQKFGWKWGVISTENQPVKLHAIKIIEKLVGSKVNKIDKAVLNQAKNFINEHFYFVNVNTADLTVDGIIKKFTELVKRKGINGYILDNWAYVEHKIPYGYTEHMYIGESLSKFRNFNTNCGVMGIIVAHPTKIKKGNDGKYIIPTLYDISGSSNWFNKADIGIIVYRHFESQFVDVHVPKVRFKWIGKVGVSGFEYDIESGRYIQIGNYGKYIDEKQPEPKKEYWPEYNTNVKINLKGGDDVPF